jgi:hypothetical protein
VYLSARFNGFRLQEGGWIKVTSERYAILSFLHIDADSRSAYDF